MEKPCAAIALDTDLFITTHSSQTLIGSEFKDQTMEYRALSDIKKGEEI
jgi:hypothetical protein